MKIIAINGSPRKDCNTATLLNKALEGAASLGADTQLMHLYDLNFKGCTSCFACKLKNGNSYGKCATQDELTQVLKDVEEVDGLLLGSPIYFGTVSAEMRVFTERLLYPYLTYDLNNPTLFNRLIKTGFIYTMGATEEQMNLFGYQQHFMSNELFMKAIFGAAESLVVTDTYQFNDYSKYVSTIFNEEEKSKRRNEQFPKDCSMAFEMGMRLAATSS